MALSMHQFNCFAIFVHIFDEDDNKRNGYKYDNIKFYKLENFVEPFHGFFFT